MANYFDLSGAWLAESNGFNPATVTLPGTLDTNQIGNPDTISKQWHPDVELGNAKELIGTSHILTRLTRKHTYEGAVYYTRTIHINAPTERVFLEAERSRELTLSVNGQAVPAYTPGTLSTPYVFEITQFITTGENTITLCCDNSYPNFPREAVLASSAATDETQTNWNGIIGYLRLRYEQPSFINSVRVYPSENAVDIAIEFDCATPHSGTIAISSTVFINTLEHPVSLLAERCTVWVRDIPVNNNTERWDEYTGVLHSITTCIDGFASFSSKFGLRMFNIKNGKLALNNRNIFLRCETNCCIFPETGHMPMAVDAWRCILKTYISYGINCVRFHSHCPPSAAFIAADELGVLIQAELSHWDTRTAYEAESSWQYFQLELRQILELYANHPSFVLFAGGNELGSGVLGYKRMVQLVATAKAIDATRLCAIGSNNFLGKIGTDPSSDFYTASNFYDTQLRGTSATMTGFINQTYPSAKTNFDDEMAEIRNEYASPVFSFEVGQFEVLPDFEEWHNHTGITEPHNYWHIKNRVAELGFTQDWAKRIEASGELALLSYREEIEAALRTEELSGLSLLALQDFTGQGTALVGMLNAHLQPKPFSFANPARFRTFFNNIAPLALLEKYTFFHKETLTAEIKLANYSKHTINEPCVITLIDGDSTILQQNLPAKACMAGTLTTVGVITLPFENINTPKRLTLQIAFGAVRNTYPIWVYPKAELSVPSNVLLTQSVNEAKQALEGGKTVFLTPPATEAQFPNSIATHFTTDFWSVGTFPSQSGFMGLLVDPMHPVFAGFPTEFHSNWQWWAMCQGRAMVLPKGIPPLITALDCYARMRHMGMLAEFKVGGGKLVISSMGLMEQLAYPEVAALVQSILSYMASKAFEPTAYITIAELANFTIY